MKKILENTGLYVLVLGLFFGSCYKLLPPPYAKDSIGNVPVLSVLYPLDNAFVPNGNLLTVEWDCIDADEEKLEFDLYFGKDPNPPFIDKINYSQDYLFNDLEENTKYYWKVIVSDDYNVVSSPVWSFTTSIIGEELHGGIVCYLDETGEHGLVCTKTNVYYDYSSDFDWGEYGNYNAFGDGIGAGLQNTINIVEAYSGTDIIAAEVCYNLTENGYSDWYLPSKSELISMFEHLYRNGIGNFHTSYWSSTEFDSTDAYYVHVNLEKNESKTYSKHVRAVRQF